jgi:type II secretory ATPase GspE/PulE/Tfp pilus assembly ATPase PilB-like protein
LGAIGWLLASGGAPGSAALPADCPPLLSQLLSDLLQADPKLRPGARAVLARLAPPTPAVASETKVHSPKTSMWEALFAPLWSRPGNPTRAVPEEQGELARQSLEQYSVLDLATVELDREVARLLPETVARSIQGVVVARPAEDELILALKDPTFVHAYDYVRMAVGNSYQVRLTRAEPLPNRVIDAVDTLLKEALALGASDIHFETFRRWMDVRYRIDGVLKRISTYPCEQASAMVKRIKVLANMDIAQERVPRGGRISVRVGEVECDLRVSVVPVQGGESAVLRLLRKNAEQLSLTQLGFPEDLQADFQTLLNQPCGMILVCGPTGSGKTTTLYSCLKQLERPDRKLLTVEDPVEYEMVGVTQVQVDTSPREPEKRVTFARVLREFLRQDPDVILVGEIRDPETAEVAVQAALAGHLLLSTLHANDALGVFARLQEMGIEPFLIGTSLIGVVSQRLARRICSECRQPVEVPLPIQERMRAAGLSQPQAFRGRGCAACLGSGYRGRVGLYEMAVVTPAVRRCLLEGGGEMQLLAALQEEGDFRRLQDHGLQMAAQGIITLDEVVRVTRGSQLSVAKSGAWRKDC